MKLTEADISICERCGSIEHIWHIWGKGDRRDEIVGSVCTRCLRTRGKANLITAVSCKIEELRLSAAKNAISGRVIFSRMFRRGVRSRDGRRRKK